MLILAGGSICPEFVSSVILIHQNLRGGDIGPPSSQTLLPRGRTEHHPELKLCMVLKYGKCFPSRSKAGLAWIHVDGLEREETVAGGKNVWPPAGPEPIQPAEKLNRTGWLMFFLPGEKQIIYETFFVASRKKRSGGMCS